MHTRIGLTLCLSLAVLTGLGGCSVLDSVAALPPTLTTPTALQRALREMPPAREKVIAAVYDFEDQTGQHKPNDVLAEYSRAVTQGGAALLIGALLDAADRGWFTVVERAGLENLLQERQLIRATRERFLGPDGQPLPDVGPLIYAGIVLEGGIISYDSNTVTGGLGARYLGVGGNTEYRRDRVTVSLRGVSTQTGEVLVAVSGEKTIYSARLQANVFKFVSFDDLLEIDAGFTRNEPVQLAVRQAIELAVYSLIMEGALRNLWAFRDPARGQELLNQYVAYKGGLLQESPMDERLYGRQPGAATAAATAAAATESADRAKGGEGN